MPKSGSNASKRPEHDENLLFFYEYLRPWYNNYCMHLLLTSAGLSNPAITNALNQLIKSKTGKSPSEAKIVFIPTAAHAEGGGKSWLINDLHRLNSKGYSEVELVELTDPDKDLWMPRIEAADVLFFGGGNTFHLMHWLQQTGLSERMAELLETRVYAGISAGSCVAGPTIYNSVQSLFDETYELEIKEGLSLVDFQFVPHLNSDFFPKIRRENILRAAEDLTEKVYAMDDETALVVVDGAATVVGVGEWVEG